MGKTQLGTKLIFVHLGMYHQFELESPAPFLEFPILKDDRPLGFKALLILNFHIKFLQNEHPPNESMFGILFSHQIFNCRMIGENYDFIPNKIDLNLSKTNTMANNSFSDMA